MEVEDGLCGQCGMTTSVVTFDADASTALVCRECLEGAIGLLNLHFPDEAPVFADSLVVSKSSEP